MRLTVHGLELWQWLGLAALLVGSALVGYVLERGVLALARLGRVAQSRWNELLLAARGPLMLALFAGLVAAAGPLLRLPEAFDEGLHLFCRSLVIVAFARFFVRGVGLLRKGLEDAYAREGRATGEVAALRTQLAVLDRVVTVVVVVVTAALLLIQVPLVRSVGVSLLASAGFAGLVVGLAAQKPLSALFSGIQLSITQPIRIGDEVVVEGESGSIEEIGLTYVVVRIWDARRLIIPITFFLEKPFQNWSRGAEGLLGTVQLKVDYLADVDAFRAELTRVLREECQGLWDGKVAGIAVTDASEGTQTLRVLLGAPSSGSSFELRCRVRERLISFLRQHPAWLPRQRTQELA